MVRVIRRLLRQLIYGANIEELYDRSRAAWARGGLWRHWARHLKRLIARRFGCYLSERSQVGQNLKLPHPVGIVIGIGVVIGNNVIIYQNVTLGAGTLNDGGQYPIVEDDVVIFAGAKIIGAVRIGKGAIIGANAVVLKDVPAGHVAVGVPAKCFPRNSASVSQASVSLQALV